jgi:diamine N-acetyltransferase
MIKGKLVCLRAMEESDADFLYECENDVEVWTISNTIIPYSKHFIREFIKRSNNDIFVDKQLRLMIIENSTQQTIGTIDIFEFDALHKRAGIGILIVKGKRKKGYATEAIKLAKHLSFQHIQLHQLFCHIIEDNKESLELFKKNGFEKSGTKKEWLSIAYQWKDVHFLQCFEDKKKK